MQVESTLKKLNKAQLITLVSALYGINSNIDDIIERHIDADQANKDSDDRLFNSLSRQISTLKCGDEFIDHRSSDHFSSGLQSLLVDIDTLVRPLKLKQAITLVESISRDNG